MGSVAMLASTVLDIFTLYRWSCIFCLFLAGFGAQVGLCFSSKVYVVYMGSKSGDDPDDVLSQNHHMLASVHGGSIEQAQASHLYSYRHGFRGFAAKLTEEQASQIAQMPGVVSVFPNLKRKLHTTRSWDFMGLLGEETMEIPGHSTKNQVNVIIGFIDTGIWPESPSFSDANMPPVPAIWRGKCEPGSIQ
uniref:Inhibitor I9 domain-containing protein n=1 Tax=Salix viminalis TaxID=40686 RepID=A0A6N2MPJ4_SALVM